MGCGMKHGKVILGAIVVLLLLCMNYPYSVKEYKAHINPAGHGDLRLVVWETPDSGEPGFDTALIDDTWRIDRVILDTLAPESKMVVRKSLAYTSRHFIISKNDFGQMLDYLELHGFRFDIRGFEDT